MYHKPKTDLCQGSFICVHSLCVCVCVCVSLLLSGAAGRPMICASKKINAFSIMLQPSQVFLRSLCVCMQEMTQFSDTDLSRPVCNGLWSPVKERANKVAATNESQFCGSCSEQLQETSLAFFGFRGVKLQALWSLSSVIKPPPV